MSTCAPAIGFSDSQWSNNAHRDILCKSSNYLIRSCRRRHNILLPCFHPFSLAATTIYHQCNANRQRPTITKQNNARKDHHAAWSGCAVPITGYSQEWSARKRVLVSLPRPASLRFRTLPKDLVDLLEAPCQDECIV